MGDITDDSVTSFNYWQRTVTRNVVNARIERVIREPELVELVENMPSLLCIVMKTTTILSLPM